MNVLTDEELISAFGDPLSENALRAMHKAIDIAVKKLAAGVSVEPVWFTVTGPDAKQRIYTASESHPENCIPLYTATALAAARVQAIEEAHAIVKADPHASVLLAHEIRALLGKEAI